MSAYTQASGGQALLSPARDRPQSLASVIKESGGTAEKASLLTREFLDEFYKAESDDVRFSMLKDRPALTGNERIDAYTAAVAEHLSYQIKRHPPGWVNESGRFLKRAWFPCGLESLKATMIAESPVAFRRRLIFVEADPLYRPRRIDPPLFWTSPS